MVYIAYFTELDLQICDCEQRRRICRENCKYALDKNFHGQFCPRRKAAKFCHPAEHGHEWMTNYLLLRLNNFILLILNCFFVPGDLFIHLADYSTSLELRLCWIYKFASLTWFSLVVCRSVSFALIMKVKVVNIVWILFLSQIQNTIILKNVFFLLTNLFSIASIFDFLLSKSLLSFW